MHVECFSCSNIADLNMHTPMQYMTFHLPIPCHHADWWLEVCAGQCAPEGSRMGQSGYCTIKCRFYRI